MVKNDIRDASTVQGSNHPLLHRQGHPDQEIIMDPRDIFLLGNTQNKHLIEKPDFESLVTYDNVYTDSTPITIYLNRFQMVAWYDANSKYGYIDPEPNNG